MYKVEVIIKRRPSILDPQGVAVQKGAFHLGLNNINGTRIGKYIEFFIEGDNEEVVKTEVNEYCVKLLSNPIIEDFEYKMEKVYES